MNIDDVQFNRGVVRPMDCLREGWQLIKEDYWLFLGITFVGTLIIGVGSIFLLGPMTCGIYLCLLQQERGKKVTFETLFQGFHYFLPSLIATLIEFVPMIFLVTCGYVAMGAGVFAMMIAIGPNQQGPPPPEFIAGLFGIYFGGIFILVLIVAIFQLFFLFAYLLIVEKGLSGWEAVRLSFRAARANFVGLFGLMLLNGLLNLLGLAACYIGMFLALPLAYAMFTIAYRQIFPHHDPFERFSDYDDDDEPDEAPVRRLNESVDTSVKVDPSS